MLTKTQLIPYSASDCVARNSCVGYFNPIPVDFDCDTVCVYAGLQLDRVSRMRDIQAAWLYPCVFHDISVDLFHDLNLSLCDALPMSLKSFDTTIVPPDISQDCFFVFPVAFMPVLKLSIGFVSAFCSLTKSLYL